jgi:hypothetical protein
MVEAMVSAGGDLEVGVSAGVSVGISLNLPPAEASHLFSVEFCVTSPSEPPFPELYFEYVPSKCLDENSFASGISLGVPYRRHISDRRIEHDEEYGCVGEAEASRCRRH